MRAIPRKGQRFKTNSTIDRTLDRVNPKFNPREVRILRELHRRRSGERTDPARNPVGSGAFGDALRTDEKGPGGRPLSVIEKPSDVKFTAGSKTDIEETLKEPGSTDVAVHTGKGNHPAAVLTDTAGLDVA